MKAKEQHPKLTLHTLLSEMLPKRSSGGILVSIEMKGKLADCFNKQLKALGAQVNRWHVMPAGTDRSCTAEVILGGVDSNCLSARARQARCQTALYFIGEVVDVTGHLSGYNCQWAW